jgi:hypothetical protein
MEEGMEGGKQEERETKTETKQTQRTLKVHREMQSEDG